MEMTPEEIKYRYFHRMPQELESIRILADFNDCKPYEIANILGIKLKLPSEKPAVKLDYALAMKVYLTGAIDREVADACGVSESTVRIWRVTEKLPSNKRRRNHQNEEQS